MILHQLTTTSLRSWSLKRWGRRGRSEYSRDCCTQFGVLPSLVPSELFVAACLDIRALLVQRYSRLLAAFGHLFLVQCFASKNSPSRSLSVSSLLSPHHSNIYGDLSGDNDDHRGSFPHKSQRQIAIGMDFFIFSVFNVVIAASVLISAPQATLLP